MSLATDTIFTRALSERIHELPTVGDRIYNTAIPGTDEDVDNTPVPYIIVKMDGLENKPGTKGDAIEGDMDSVTVSVEITGNAPDELVDLGEWVRETIAAYIIDHYDEPAVPTDYTFSASPRAYDPLKPCYYQTLIYQCESQK